MERSTRLGTTIAVAGLAAFALTLNGCTKPGTSNSDGGPNGGSCASGTAAEVEANCMCQTLTDCQSAAGTQNWACSNANKCIQTCSSAAMCTVGSATICQNAICLPPACGNDSECSTGQQCVAATCQTAFTSTDVTSCAVAPLNGAINTGGSKNFWVVTYNSSGAEIAYEGSVTWTAPTGMTATASTQKNEVGLSNASGTGAGMLTASIGSATCSAGITGYAANGAGKLRVVVVDEITGAPVTGATVQDGLTTGKNLTDNNDGSYSETAGTAPYTISVFKSGYTYTTVAGTTTTDLYIPIKSAADTNPGTFTGMLTDADFNNLSVPTGTVHLDISGGSIAGNLIDLSLSTLLGSSVPTMINLGGTTAENVNLPNGISIGLGPTMFKGSYAVEATPGVRALWGIGGNVTLQVVLSLVSQVTGSSSLNIGSILTAALPLLSELQTGITGGVAVTPGEAGTLTTTAASASATNPYLLPDTLMRLQLSATAPTLPTYFNPSDNMSGCPAGPSGALSAAVVLGGALVSPQGFVPLGLTAGVAATGSTSLSAMALAMAPRNGGIENSPYVALALAADLSSLSSSFGSTCATYPLVLSGDIYSLGQVDYNVSGTPGGTTNFTFAGQGGSFLGVPKLPAVSVVGRTLIIQADATGAAAHRIDIGSTTANMPTEWEVWFPPQSTSAASTITIPAVPSGFTDYLSNGGSPPNDTLDTVTLGLKLDGSTAAPSYNDIVSFQKPATSGASAATVDDLTYQIDQFSVEELVPGT